MTAEMPPIGAPGCAGCYYEWTADGPWVEWSEECPIHGRDTAA